MNLNLKKKIAIIILPLIFFGIATTVIFNKNVVESKLPLKICLGEFAFCGASSTKPTGNKMIVNGKEFYEGEAICPVMTGPSIANMELMNNSCDAPDGTDKTVWSLFWYYDTTTTIPQFNPSTKEWEYMTPVNRSFVINLDSPSTSESNMFAMPGVIFDTTSTGIVLAKVYGPLNEAAVPLRKAIPVKNGMTSITAAKLGSPYPVGTPIPVFNYSKKLKKI